MRKILFTVHKFFPEHRAGTEVLTLKVAQELQRRGNEVLVLTAEPPDIDARHKRGAETSQYVYEGIPVKVIGEPMRLSGYSFRHEYYHPRIKQYFNSLLHEFQPDLVHVFHAQNLSASIIEAANECNIPVVCSATDFWFVCPIVQLKRPNGAVCRGPGPKALKCLTCYTPKLFPPQEEFEEALQTRLPTLSKALESMPGFVRTLGARTLYAAYKTTKLNSACAATIERPGRLRQLANQTQAIMVPTALMRDIFAENGIDQRLLHLVRFGIDTSPLLPYRRKSESKTLRIGFIGTLFEHKGVDLLIEAFQGLPPGADASLKIYGDPNQFPDYGRFLVDLARKPSPHADKISFCGTFPNSQLGPVLQELDLLVVPSRWYENTPLVLQSALATATPLIVTDLGGLSELVKHGHNGLVFDLNDKNSLRQQLLKVLNDRQFLHQLTANIEPERTIAEMVNDIEAIYSKTVPAPMHGTIHAAVAGPM